MVFRSAQCWGLTLALAATPAFAMHSHRSGSHRASHERRHHAAAHVAHWTPGQREIDPDRTRAIQQALISRNYLTGAPSGMWDADTEAAMQKFQADNGWQTKLMPDSRALIKLGLGPDVDEGVSVAQGDGAGNGTLQQATNADSLAEVHSILN